MRTRTLTRAASHLRLLQFTPTSVSIVLPENTSEASEAQLKTVVAEAVEALKGFQAKGGAISDEELEEARRLAGIVTDGRKELDSRAEAAGARKGALDELLAGLTPEAPAGAAPAAEPAAPAAAPEAAPAAAETAAVEVPKASEVKNAGGGAVVPDRAREIASLAAAPDAVGVSQGHVFEGLREAADSIIARTSGYPSGPTGSPARFQHGALRIKRTFDASLVASGYEDDEVLDRAVSFDRIGGQDALLAAGGWAAASETLYDLVELEKTDGMIDVPEIQVVRGGIRFTRGPAYSTFRGQGFTQSEAQAIAGTAKTFFTVPSVNFVEVRAGVVGLGVTAGILQQKAYPESVARILRGLLVAHTHDVNKTTISDIETGSTAVTVNLGKGATAQLLSAIELQVVDIRYQYGMAETDVLEVALPQWGMALLRQDLAFKNGWNAERIPDSEINALFAERHVRVQWVQDWQDTALGVVGAPATAWPTTIKFLIYPAGTWVRGLGDVITVDTLYDSVGLGNNNYTALFTEESLLVVMRGFESRVVSVPVTADGSSPAIFQTHAN